MFQNVRFQEPVYEYEHVTFFLIILCKFNENQLCIIECSEASVYF
jgi:hypothetical protein